MRALAALALLLLVSCGGSSPDETPEGAMMSFLRAVEKDDCEAARAAVVTPSAFDCSQVEAYQSLFGELSPDDAEITERSRAGSSAVVTVTWPEGTSDFEVEQVDDSWKVVLDTSP